MVSPKTLRVQQRTILALGVLGVTVMALFPPWVLVFEGPIRTKRFAGYHPLWESNTPTDEAALAKLFSMEVAHPKYFSIEVDVARLTIQIVTLLIVTIFLVVILNNRKG